MKELPIFQLELKWMNEAHDFLGSPPSRRYFTLKNLLKLIKNYSQINKG